MGGSCSHAADVWANLATKEEVRDAVRSIEAWQKAQELSKVTGGGGHRNTSTGPLLQRVGGLDVVKQVVESFYKKLYSDPRLLVFLHDKDIVYLRAKQTLFMSWLFGPPNQPYTGRNVRVAHLRLIRHRGFGPEDFELGMTYFEQAMRELDAPESIISEVMSKVRPFKAAIFTPCDKDADEEARWAVEDRLKEHMGAEKGRRQLQSQSSRWTPLKGAPSSRALGTGDIAAGGSSSSSSSSHGPQCPFTAGGGGSGRSGSGRQCPFTAGGVSRPSSSQEAARGARVSRDDQLPAPPAAPAPPPPSGGTEDGAECPSSVARTSFSHGNASPLPAALTDTCNDGSEAPAAIASAAAAAAAATADLPVTELPAAAVAVAMPVVPYTSSANGCEDLGELSRFLKPSVSSLISKSRRSSATPQPQTPDAVPWPVSSSVAAPPPSQLQPPTSRLGPPRPTSASTPTSTTSVLTPQPHTTAADASRPAAPAAAGPELQTASGSSARPLSRPTSAAAPAPPEQLPASVKSGSRPVTVPVAPPPPPSPPPASSSLGSKPASAAAPAAQPVIRPPSAVKPPPPPPPSKPGSRPPSSIPQPPPKRPTSRPASGIPRPPPPQVAAVSALSPQVSRSGSGRRPMSASPVAPSSAGGGPFSVARDLAGLARSARSASASVGAAGFTSDSSAGGESLLQGQVVSSMGPCAESAEVEKFWEAELKAATQLQDGASAVESRTCSRSASARGAGLGERPALAALEMAVEMGLAEPEEGGRLPTAAGSSSAAAGGVELVDAFLTEMFEREARERAEEPPAEGAGG